MTDDRARTVALPFASKGLLTVHRGFVKMNGTIQGSGEAINATGKIVLLECSEEESMRFDEIANIFANEAFAATACRENLERIAAMLEMEYDHTQTDDENRNRVRKAIEKTRAEAGYGKAQN